MCSRTIKPFFFFLIIVNLSFCQSETKKDLLLGKWDAYKMTTSDGGDGSEYTSNGKPFTITLELEFLGPNEVYYNPKVPGENVVIDYRLEGDRIITKYIIYVIKEISEEHMILQKDNALGLMYYFDKVNN
ncbi:MAG: hypothetical protein ABJN84_05310 [Flavobacteriaceae bacterium]